VIARDIKSASRPLLREITFRSTVTSAGGTLYEVKEIAGLAEGMGAHWR